ncbi:MAG: hypothetical protein IKZ88_05490 [Neisseriaceae bacterium]|nr:hypothetical protein [Neisseriaceae bacterium]
MPTVTDKTISGSLKNKKSTPYGVVGGLKAHPINRFEYTTKDKTDKRLTCRF